MQKGFITPAVALIVATLFIGVPLAAWYTAEPEPQVAEEVAVGGFGDPFTSLQLATDPDSGECLTTNGTENAWSTSCSGSSGATTTINGVSGPAFTFASGTATGIGLTISTSTGTITFTPTVSSGYVIPLSASTTAWNSFYNTPSSRITAGDGVSWSSNTLNLDINELTEESGFTAGDYLAFYDATAGAVRKVNYNDLPGAGGGLTSLNGLTIASQTFATSSDTNIGINVVSSGSTHTFTPTWTGTLAVSRGGTGAGSLTGLVVGNGTSAMTATTTSAGLAAVLSNETGTGSVVFSASPTLTGNTTLANASTTNLTVSTNSYLGTVRSGTWNGSTIGETYGGTGQTTYATGDMLYASGANTLAKRTIGSTGDILMVSGGVPTWTATSSLGLGTTFFQQNGNSFGTTATLGTNDANALAFETGGTARMTILSSGNVGIGDATPSAMLTVGSGDLFQVNSSGAIAAATGITSSGTITFSGITNGVVVANGSGVLSASSTISSSLIQDSYLLNTGDTGSGTYTFTGQIDIGLDLGAEKLNVYRTTAATSSTEYNAVIRSDSVTTSASTLTNVALYAQALHHGNSTTGISGLTSLIASISNSDTTTVTTGKMIDVTLANNSGTLTNTYGVYVGDITAGTQTNTPYSFYASDSGAYNYFAGNVGIGTTTPHSALAVTGTAYKQIELGVTGSPAYSFFNTDGTSSAIWDINRRTSDGAFVDTGRTHSRIIMSSTNGDGYIAFSSSDTNNTLASERMRIDGSGNVGIGTTSPNKLLHVAAATTPIAQFDFSTNTSYTGLKLSEGNPTDFSAGTNQSWIMRPGSNFGTANRRGNLEFLNYSNDITFWTGSSTLTERLRITSTGNVGIGTTTPAARLQITGLAGTNPFRVASSSNTSLFEITQLGRVGIGSSSPSHTLTVAGDLNVTGAPRISIPRSFTWPGVATTTSATSTVPLGIAMSAEAWNSARCKTTSGTAAWLFKDDAGNRMNGGTASTTSTSTLVTLSTNNTFTTGEGRNMDIGPLTNAMITCSVDVTINN